MLIRNQNQYCTLNRINNTPKSNNYKTYILSHKIDYHLQVQLLKELTVKMKLKKF